MKLPTQIKRLVDYQVPLDESHLLLSFYLPIKVRQINDLKTTIKSKVLKVLREDPRISEFHQFHHEIVQAIFAEIDWSHLQNGIAVFAHFDLASIKEVFIFDLQCSPNEECRLGKIFDFDQLISQCYFDNPAVVLNFDKECCKVYLFRDNDLKLLKEVPNEGILLQSRYRNSTSGAHSGGGSGPVVFSSLNKQRQREFLLQDLVVQITDYLNTYLGKHPDIDVVVSVTPKIFIKFMTHLRDHINLNANANLWEVEKQVSTEKELRELVQHELTEARSTIVRETVAAHLNTPGKTARELEEIVTAANEGRISDLYFDSHIKHAGYVKGNMLSLQPIKGAYRIYNLGNWLIRKIISMGGNVRPLPNHIPQLKHRPMIGILRY